MKNHNLSLLSTVKAKKEFYFGNYNTDIITHKLSSEVYGAIDLRYPA